VTGLQTTLINRIGAAPKIVHQPMAKVAHCLMAHALGLGLSQIVQVGWDGGLQGVVGHGGSWVGCGWFELY
jgi:hypothetical protein